MRLVGRLECEADTEERYARCEDVLGAVDTVAEQRNGPEDQADAHLQHGQHGVRAEREQRGPARQIQLAEAMTRGRDCLHRPHLIERRRSHLRSVLPARMVEDCHSQRPR